MKVTTLSEPATQNVNEITFSEIPGGASSVTELQQATPALGPRCAVVSPIPWVANTNTNLSHVREQQFAPAFAFWVFDNPSTNSPEVSGFLFGHSRMRGGCGTI